MCLWDSFVCVCLLWEEGQCTETWPKELRDRVTMAALYPQLIPLLFDAQCTCIITSIHAVLVPVSLKANSCMDWKPCLSDTCTCTILEKGDCFSAIEKLEFNMEWYTTCSPYHSHYVTSMREQWTIGQVSFSRDYTDLSLSVCSIMCLWCSSLHFQFIVHFQEGFCGLQSYH